VLINFFESHRPKLKEADAVMLLQRASGFLDADKSRLAVPFSLERTIFLDAMINEAERISAQDDASGMTGESEQSNQTEVLRHEILLRLLARREATRVGLDCDEFELQEASDTFASALGFDSCDVLRDMLRGSGITEQAFAAMMTDATLLAKLDRHYDREIQRFFADHIRIRTFRHKATHSR